jgi:hypothetical protein
MGLAQRRGLHGRRGGGMTVAFDKRAIMRNILTIG